MNEDLVTVIAGVLAREWRGDDVSVDSDRALARKVVRAIRDAGWDGPARRNATHGRSG